MIMKAVLKHFKSRDLGETKIVSVNWDAIFLKGFIIFGALMFLGFVVFCLWFLM